jgi:hypothetical protein
MATIRVSLRWQQTNTRTGGWSENFWLSSSSIQSAYPLVFPLIQALSTFKGNQTFCPRFRLSQYGTSRLAQTFNTNRSNNVQGGATLDSDYPTTRIQVKMIGAAPQSTTQWIGGILDRDTAGGGFWTPVGSSSASWLAVKNILTSGANGWSVYVLSPAVLPVVVAAFADATGILTTAAAHGLVTNDIVRVSRIHGIEGINGVWRVQLVDTTNVKLLGWVATGGTMTRSPAATVRKQERVLQQITDASIIQLTSHRVGRPTGLLGGRRKRPGISLVGPLAAK